MIITQRKKHVFTRQKYLFASEQSISFIGYCSW